MDIIQGNVRLKRKRKWKTRWAVLRRVNPAADVINLIFYKDQVSAQTRQKEKLFVSLADYCGLQSLEKLDKIFTVIVVVTVTETVSFGFTSIEDRADWLHALQNHFGEERSYDGVIPSRQKFKPLEATLRVYNTHFCITRRDTYNCLGRWKYEDVPYYGAVEGGFAFKSATSDNQEDDQQDLHFISTRSGREINQLFDAVCRIDRHGSLQKVTYSEDKTDTIERRKTVGQPNFLKRAFLRLSRRGTRKRTRSEGAVLEKYSKRDKAGASKRPPRRAAHSEADTLDNGKNVTRPLPTPPGAVNKNKSLTGERFRFDSASIEAYSGPKNSAPRKLHRDSPLTLPTKDALGYELVNEPKHDIGYEMIDSPENMEKRLSHISPRIENIKPDIKPRVGLTSIIDKGVVKDGVRKSFKEDENIFKEGTIPVIEIQDVVDDKVNDSGKTSDGSPEKETLESEIGEGITASGRDSGIEKDVENEQHEVMKLVDNNTEEGKVESGTDIKKENEMKNSTEVETKVENEEDANSEENVLSPNDSVITGEELDGDVTGNDTSCDLSVDHVTSPPVSAGLIYEPMGSVDEGSEKAEETSTTNISEEPNIENAPKDSNNVKSTGPGPSILTRRTSNNKTPFQQLTVNISKEDKVKPRLPTPPPQSASSDYVNLRGSEVFNNVSPQVKSAEAVAKVTPVIPQKKSKTPWSKYDGIDDSVYHSVESLMPDGRRAVHGYQNIKYSDNGRAHSFESLDGVHSYANMPAPQYQNLGPTGRSYINVPSKKKVNLNYIQVGVAELGPPTPRSQVAMVSEYTFIDEVKTNVLKKAAREHSFLRKENLARVTKK